MFLSSRVATDCSTPKAWGIRLAKLKRAPQAKDARRELAARLRGRETPIVQMHGFQRGAAAKKEKRLNESLALIDLGRKTCCPLCPLPQANFEFYNFVRELP